MSNEFDFSTLLPAEQRVVDTLMQAAGGMTIYEAYRSEFPLASARKASNFFKRADVMAYKQFQQEMVAESSRIQMARIDQELASIAFTNIQDLDILSHIDSQGRATADLLSVLPRHQAAAIQSIKFKGNSSGNGPVWIADLKMHDKAKPLDMLIRRKGGYAEDNKQRVIDNPLQNLMDHIQERNRLPKPLMDEGPSPMPLQSPVVSEQFPE